MDDDIRYEQHLRRVLRTPLLVLQPLMLVVWPVSLLCNPLIGSAYKPRYLALTLLLLAVSALLSLARGARMMSITFTGNIWALALAFRIEIEDGGALGNHWNLPIALIAILGTSGMTYHLSHYLITLIGAGLILFIGQAHPIPAVMPIQLVGLMMGTALTIGIAYNHHVSSQWMRRTFILKERYRIMAETDELTRIANRRKLLQRLSAALEESQSKAAHFVMLDIDNFKQINDQHGHQVGDDVLVTVAREIDQLYPALLGGRLGGEEFGLLAHGLDEAQVSHLLETLRKRLADAEPLGIRFSAGVLRLDPQVSLNESLRRADEGLYQAKRLGKDQVVWPR